MCSYANTVHSSTPQLRMAGWEWLLSILFFPPLVVETENVRCEQLVNSTSWKCSAAHTSHGSWLITLAENPFLYPLPFTLRGVIETVQCEPLLNDALWKHRLTLNCFLHHFLPHH